MTHNYTVPFSHLEKDLLKMFPNSSKQLNLQVIIILMCGTESINTYLIQLLHLLVVAIQPPTTTANGAVHSLFGLCEWEKKPYSFMHKLTNIKLDLGIGSKTATTRLIIIIFEKFILTLG